MTTMQQGADCGPQTPTGQRQVLLTLLPLQKASFSSLGHALQAGQYFLCLPQNPRLGQSAQ